MGFVDLTQLMTGVYQANEEFKGLPVQYVGVDSGIPQITKANIVLRIDRKSVV